MAMLLLSCVPALFCSGMLPNMRPTVLAWPERYCISSAFWEVLLLTAADTLRSVLFVVGGAGKQARAEGRKKHTCVSSTVCKKMRMLASCEALRQLRAAQQCHLLARYGFSEDGGVAAELSRAALDNLIFAAASWPGLPLAALLRLSLGFPSIFYECFSLETEVV